MYDVRRSQQAKSNRLFATAWLDIIRIITSDMAWDNVLYFFGLLLLLIPGRSAANFLF
jgi:hypothetical protein